MRIGIDARLWNESGVGRYIRSLVKYLQIIDKKNEYILFVLSKDYDRVRFQILSNQQTQEKFQIINVDIRWHTLAEQLRFPNLLNKENLDLVHFPYFSVPVFYNRPFVVTIHDLILHHFSTGEASTLPLPLYKLKRLGYKFIIKRAAEKAEKIIAVSNTTKKEIADHLGINEDKVIVVYNGVDKVSDVRYRTSGFKLKTGSYFLYVGNAYPHKNLNVLLEAFEVFLKNSSSKIQLILVGKDDYFYQRLKEKVRQMNVQQSVIFYGEANDEELVSLYKNAIGLIIPSLMEGFGLPIVEAMAQKCLVLASDIPVLREIAKDSAIYFDPHNMFSIEKKIREIASKKRAVFRQNIEEGYKRAKMFSWEKAARETLAVYESCAGLR